jgi:hypothetical protein
MIIVAILAVAFIAGVITGIVVLLCASIAREDDDKSLMRRPPTRAAATTRRVIGWHGSMPENVIPLHQLAEPIAARSGR